MGQSRIDNTETLATLIGYTRHRTRTNKNTTQKTKKRSNADPTNNRDEPKISKRVNSLSSYRIGLWIYGVSHHFQQ